MVKPVSPQIRCCENCKHCEVQAGTFKVYCYCWNKLDEVNRLDVCNQYERDYDKAPGIV